MKITIDAKGLLDKWFDVVKRGEKYYELNPLGYIEPNPTTSTIFSFRPTTYPKFGYHFDTVTKVYTVTFEDEIVWRNNGFHQFQGFKDDCFIINKKTYNKSGEIVQSDIKTHDSFGGSFYYREGYIFQPYGLLDQKVTRDDGSFVLILGENLSHARFAREYKGYILVSDDKDKTALHGFVLGFFHMDHYNAKIHWHFEPRVMSTHLLKTAEKIIDNHWFRVLVNNFDRPILEPVNQNLTIVRFTDKTIEIDEKTRINCLYFEMLEQSDDVLFVPIESKEFIQAVTIPNEFNWKNIKILDFLNSNYISWYKEFILQKFDNAILENYFDSMEKVLEFFTRLLV